METEYDYYTTQSFFDKVIRYKIPVGDKRKSLEERLSGYKNRMELLRTVIGVIVLGIQLVIVYHLLTK